MAIEVAVMGQVMKSKHPKTNAKWLSEILLAIEDARGESVDPKLFEPGSHPLLGDEEIEFDAEEVEEMRRDDIRQCTRDLLLMEGAREWLLEEGL